MKSSFYDVKSGDWEKLPGQKRKIIHMDNLTVMAIRVDKGTVTDAGHSHPHEQAAVVLSGKIKFFIADETRILGPGDGYLVKPNLKHHIEALEDTVLIDYFSPRRSDLKATE